MINCYNIYLIKLKDVAFMNVIVIFSAWRGAFGSVMRHIFAFLTEAYLICSENM